jgi:hypothetical protein
MVIQPRGAVTKSSFKHGIVLSLRRDGLDTKSQPKDFGNERSGLLQISYTNGPEIK